MSDLGVARARAVRAYLFSTGVLAKEIEVDLATAWQCSHLSGEGENTGKVKRYSAAFWSRNMSVPSLRSPLRYRKVPAPVARSSFA